MAESAKPGDIEALIALARGTRYESIANDEQALERLLLEEMSKSQDPMTREIGTGIADGTMNWRTVATSSAYSEYLDRGVEGMREFDFDAAFGTPEARAEEPPEPERRPERDEDEAFNRGILRKRNR